MRRALRYGCLALAFSGGLNYASADEWRTTRREATPAATDAPAPSEKRVKLGRPVQLGKPVATRKGGGIEDAGVVRTAYAQPKLAAPRKAGSIVRAQGPEPGRSEESFNCGVVTEGPPCRESCFSRCRNWCHNLFSGCWPESGPAIGDSFNMTRGGFESDHAFDSFISPVSNPFFFEDPRSLTELRIVAMQQSIPSGNPTFGGGDIQFFGLQGRLALTENWSIVMPKLGYVNFDPDSGSGGSGLSEIMIGPKYTFWRDDATNTIAAVGLNFEIPVASSDASQDHGDFGLTPYITAGQKLGNFHVLGTVGYRFGLDDSRSDSLFVSGHLDYSILDRIYPLVEVNWYHYTSGGDNAATHGFEGQDLINFGSTGVAGNDVVTLAAGVRFKITESIQAGVVYEIPLTGQEDLLDYRITADIIFRY